MGNDERPSNHRLARARARKEAKFYPPPTAATRPPHVPRPIAYRVTRWTFTALTPYLPPVISSRDHVSFSL